jgi:hypothetical protein
VPPSSPRGRAVVLSSVDPGVEGRVFELSPDRPVVSLAGRTVLSLLHGAFWVRAGAATWINGERIAEGDAVPLSGGEVVASGGEPDASGRVTGGSILLFDATPSAVA